MNSSLRESLDRMGVPREIVATATSGEWLPGGGTSLQVNSPIDGSRLAELSMATSEDVSRSIHSATEAFCAWRVVPAPRRGEFVRQIGQELRKHKSDLAQVISWEAGKILQESLGEVQEMIDICDFAVGLSRQLYGLTMASERPLHRLAEQWHPLGPVGIISAFNFPVAVWAWNAMLALVCGDSIIWKPSEKTPLCALACHGILQKVAQSFAEVPDGLASVVVGHATVGQTLAQSAGVPLISATGSTPMGRAVGQTVAARLGRSLLELGGNNATIVAPSADMELAVRGIVFSAAGTCGQRCTSLRRLIVHESLAQALTERVVATFANLRVGNPLDPDTLVGPLIDTAAGERMQEALSQAKRQGGQVHGGELVTAGVPGGGCYVRPAVVEISADAAVVQQETFAPILYVIPYDSFQQAIAIQNEVPQGLASSVFTSDVREAELFCSPTGSDCGIANVNIGPSGAEIGGAFGGEKDTGGGRESGSDSWKAYMRRATNTINYSTELPLAQGIQFG
ncbi:MAG: aldehyde dehydrogenase family protein [Fuerstiella sp.]|nr:aldehyde dehydrogenase family protein [Fuerstiella sp.]MCP4858691.1 aldehyde dehydrogenase family protein [Fuerstiella sp.]